MKIRENNVPIIINIEIYYENYVTKTSCFCGCVSNFVLKRF